MKTGEIMDSLTSVFAVIGDPIKHSLSPFMHNLAFELTGYNGVYTAFHSRDARGAVIGVKALGIKGLSVTIPHKESIMPFLDELTESAEKIGAVNTITNKDGVLEGDNTDWIGIARSIKEHIEIKGKKVLVVGAGGASRAVCFAINKEGGNLYVMNRTKSRGVETAEDFKGKYIEGEEIEKLSPEIIINTTSVGMYPKTDVSPVDEKIFSNCSLALDIIYNPIETKFLRDAKKMGAKTISGIGMFVYQGGTQFEKWTDKEFPFQLIKERLFRKLISRG